MLPPIRRIVTSHDGQGKSCVMIDGPTPHVLETRPGRGLIDLWRTEAPDAPDRGDADLADTRVVLDPPAGGTVFRYFQVAPAKESANLSTEEQQAAYRAMFERMGGSHSQVNVDRHPAMHKTKTVDYIILLRGQIRLVLDAGEVDLEPFDVVVQRGTNHAWINLGDEPALLMAVLMDNPS